VDEIQGLPNTPQKPYLAGVRAEVARLQRTAAALDLAETQALPGLSSASQDQLAGINRILFRTERSLTMDPGLPGRPWYRHRIYAPGRYTGYDAKTLPGIREAVEAGKPDEAREQAGQVVQVLRALNDQMTEAAKLLKQL
jgi:N-acetylated-alpha-linked acidic dipeptidase